MRAFKQSVLDFIKRTVKWWRAVIWLTYVASNRWLLLNLFPMYSQVSGHKPVTMLLSYACLGFICRVDNYIYNNVKATKLHIRNNLASGLPVRVYTCKYCTENIHLGR